MLNICGLELNLGKLIGITILIILASNLYTGVNNAIETVKSSNTHISK